MKRRIATGILVLAAIALVSGATLLALASPGSQEDPVITLSYLTDKFKPEIISEVKAAEKRITDSFDVQINTIQTQLQSQGAVAPQEPEDADRFIVVTLTKGQSLSCSIGTEIMLRVGTANAVGSTSPALVNYTSAASIESGTALVVNNMYLVTIDGSGVTATADTVRLMVRGEHKVS